MKVLIVGFTIEKYMPYLKKYKEVLDKCGCDYEIVYMNRDNSNKSFKKGNRYYFNYSMPIEKRIWSKFLPYYGYMKYVSGIIKERHYDKLIFLTTAPAVLLMRNYIKKYRKKYILDYRDYTFEKIGFYHQLVMKIVANSFVTFISSNGFRKYVGNGKNVYLNHNISQYVKEIKYEEQKKTKRK